MEEEQDIQSDIVKQRQLRDAQENQEFDRDMDAYRRGKGLTDEQRKKALLDNAKKKQLLGSRMLDAIEYGAVGSVKWLQKQAEEDPDRYTDDMLRLLGGGLKNIGWALSKVPFLDKIAQGEDWLAEQARAMSAQLTPQLDPRFAGWGTRVATGLIADKGISKATGAVTKGVKAYKAVSQADEIVRARRMQLATDLQMNIKKGEGYSYRKGRLLNNPVWDNLSPKVQKGFADAGIDSDKASFFIENWTREVGATVEGLPFTDRTFEFMKSELLPKILEDMKGIDFSDGLQLDHIAQLRAMTPFYQGRNLKQAEKIRRILIKEGIFGGHNPKNLKYLPTDVHTVKTRFWEDQVGKDGSKFFKGRPMRTYADVEKAAKEMKQFINRSNALIETVSAQYRFMRKKTISAEELGSILKKVDLNYGTYNLKEVRKLIKQEINVDILSKSKKGLDELEEAKDALTAKDEPLPYRYEDETPPTRKRSRKRKSELEKIAEKEFKKEQKRKKKLGGQQELPLDE